MAIFGTRFCRIGLLLLTTVMGFIANADVDIPQKCNYPECNITWEREFEFPAIAQTFEVPVFANASEVVVKAVSGSPGTVRQFIIYMPENHTRFLTDFYDKLISSGGTGMSVTLGPVKTIEYLRIKADSWGGSGTKMEVLVQLRERKN